MAASVPEQLGEDRPNRQTTNPQDDARGPVNDGSFTGRWADRYPKDKTSAPVPGEDDAKQVADNRKAAAKAASEKDGN